MAPDQGSQDIREEESEDSSGTYQIPGVAFSALGALVSAQTPQPVSPARVVSDLYAVKPEYADTFMKMLKDANKAAVEHRNAETECLKVQATIAKRWQFIFVVLFVVLVGFCGYVVYLGHPDAAVQIFHMAATLFATGFGAYCLIKVIGGFSRSWFKKEKKE